MQSQASRTMMTSSIGEMVIHDALMLSATTDDSAMNPVDVRRDAQDIMMSADPFSTFCHTEHVHDLTPTHACQTTQGTSSTSLLMDEFLACEGRTDVLDDMATPLSLAPNDEFEDAFLSLLSPPETGHLGIDTQESDISLLVDFMDHSFARQYLLHRPPLTAQKSWLMRLMLGSAPFYYASLSTSAYHVFVSEASDAETRQAALESYEKHREKAMREFDKLESTLPSTHGATIMCGVHIALLEVRWEVYCDGTIEPRKRLTWCRPWARI